MRPPYLRRLDRRRRLKLLTVGFVPIIGVFAAMISLARFGLWAIAVSH